MSKDEDKIKHSRRLLKDENAINKQLKIAKQHGLTPADQAVNHPIDWPNTMSWTVVIQTATCVAIHAKRTRIN
jgi:hypothetical protein